MVFLMFFVLTNWASDILIGVGKNALIFVVIFFIFTLILTGLSYIYPGMYRMLQAIYGGEDGPLIVNFDLKKTDSDKQVNNEEKTEDPT